MSITITQGDYVLYQDTSVGNPTSRAWNFPGGTPTGGTAANPVVRYLSPSNTGFSAKLTITRGVINSIKNETNIIIVTPENISVTLTNNVPTGTTIPMGANVNYTAAGSTASLSYYSWNLAGLAGFTGTNQIHPTNILSWLDLTGSDLGATYSTYTSTSSVVFNSFLGNTSTSSINITYSKNGEFEAYNYLNDAFVLGANYYYVTNTGVKVFTVGMSGVGDIFKVDTNNYGLLPINNIKFRAQDEFVSYWSSSQDIEISPGNYGYYPGQYVASNPAFMILAVPQTGWGPLSRYAIGNYMIPGDLGTYFSHIFYFADVLGYGESIKVNRYWNNNLVNSLIFNETSFGYQSSRALELSLSLGNAPTAYIMGLDGANGLSGGTGGACLPSSVFSGSLPIVLYLTVKFSHSGSIDTIDPSLDVIISVLVSDISINFGQGNSPDGNLVFMQDTPGGTGVATAINNALIAYGYDSNIVASASPDYAWASESGWYDVNTFNGLKIAIIDRGIFPPYIAAVDLSDNGPWPSAPYFGVPNVTGSSNWISFNTNRIANPYQLNFTFEIQPKRGWEFGY
jgi:hypothetical protein